MTKEKVEKKQPVKKSFKEMTQKEKTKKILSILGSIFQLVLVVIALIMSVVVIVYTYDREANELPSLFGISFLTVQSESMDYDGQNAQAYYKGEGAKYADAAQFKKYDMIIVKEWAYGKSEDLKIGDVVTFYDSSIPVTNAKGEQIGWFNTHRIVDISEDGMHVITRGDNNLQDDPEKSVASIKAVWTGSKITGWGKIIDWIKDSTHFLLVIVLPLALLFFFNIFMFVRELVKHNVDKNSKNLAAEKAAAVEAAKQAAIAEYLASLEKQNAEENNASTVADAAPEADTEVKTDDTTE